MQFRDGLEAFLHGRESDQRHVLLIRLHEYLNFLDVPKLAEDPPQRRVIAVLLLDRRHMQRLGRRVDCDGTFGCESLYKIKYLPVGCLVEIYRLAVLKWFLFMFILGLAISEVEMVAAEVQAR